MSANICSNNELVSLSSCVIFPSDFTWTEQKMWYNLCEKVHKNAFDAHDEEIIAMICNTLHCYAMGFFQTISPELGIKDYAISAKIPPRFF